VPLLGGNQNALVGRLADARHLSKDCGFLFEQRLDG